jgi:dTDP-4-dehydrorhamnose 3,5-epimerase
MPGSTSITYLVDGYYDPADELGVAWDDPALGIEWPGTDPVLSERDRQNPRRVEIESNLRPRL